jgi:hypothetical protein
MVWPAWYFGPITVPDQPGRVYTHLVDESPPGWLQIDLTIEHPPHSATLSREERRRLAKLERNRA